MGPRQDSYHRRTHFALSQHQSLCFLDRSYEGYRSEFLISSLPFNFGTMSAEEKSLGGSPTPNTDDTAKRAAGSTLPPHSELVRNGWKLVRHCPVGDRWHSAADHLRGTEVYGDPSGVDRPDAPEWSVRFDNEPFDEFLFATGE